MLQLIRNLWRVYIVRVLVHLKCYVITLIKFYRVSVAATFRCNNFNNSGGHVIAHIFNK